MSDASKLTLVTFHNTCAIDTIEKLRREVDRIECADDSDSVRDHVVNAFWTAWHVHQWMWDTIRDKPSLKLAVLKYRGIERHQIEDHETFGALLASRFVPLKICRLIAASSQYVQVSLTGEHGLLLLATPDSNSVRSTPMVMLMGRPIAATRLLVEIDDYWVTMILDCGIE
jgi:hypothetical protein